jgi:hypothetical protein
MAIRTMKEGLSTVDEHEDMRPDAPFPRRILKSAVE